MTVYQLQICSLTRRHRRQASSHIWTVLCLRKGIQRLIKLLKFREYQGLLIRQSLQP